MQGKTLVVTMMLIVGKFLGVLRESTLAYFYGANIYSDIYLTSALIPEVIFGIVSIGIASTFIPIYGRLEHDEGRKSADIFFNSIINVLAIISIIVILLSIIFIDDFVLLFARGFDAQSLSKTIDFTKITIWSLLFNAQVHLFKGYLEYHGWHKVGPISGIIFNITLILAISLSYYLNPKIMAYGFLISVVLQVLFQIVILKKKEDYKYKPLIKLSQENVTLIISLALPIIISASIEQVNNIIDRSMASSLASGSISILNYATILGGSVNSLFVTAVIIVLFPELTKLAAESDSLKFRETVMESIRMIILILLPASIGIFILSGPIVELVFGRGVFSADPNALILTSKTLRAYCLGIIAIGLRTVITRIFYSVQDTKKPMVSGIITVLINIVLNIVLSRRFGVVGLALATSTSSIIGLIFLIIGLKDYAEFNKKDLVLLFKIVISSLVMGVIVFIQFRYFPIKSALIEVTLSALVGVIVYFSVLILLGVIKLDNLKKFIKEKE